MQTHVKVLGVLHLVLGALGVIGALTVMLVFGGAAGLAGASGDPDAITAIPILGLIESAVVTVIMILSLPGVVVGIGLLQFRPWAKIGGIVLSIFHLIGFPFGTVLGIYGLWVLLSRETEPVFAPAAIAPAPVPSTSVERLDRP